MRDMTVNELKNVDEVVTRTEQGKWIVPPKGKPFTPENAREMQTRAVAKKREVMLRASGQAVENKQLIAEYGEYAPVAERAQTLQRIASTPEAGKAAVMAHQALTLDTGMGEKQADVMQSTPSDQVGTALLTLVSLLRDVVTDKAQVVDATVTDIGT